MKEKLTAKEITVALWWHFSPSSDILIPRYTPRDWWECDMWRLTKNGFVDEFEVKTNIADFKADSAKVKRGHMLFDSENKTWIESKEERKHELLQGESKGPNRFWFVLPRELIGQVEIPEYAGLVSVGGSTHIEKPAPKRHFRKWDGNREKVFQTFYFRFWTHETKTKIQTEASREHEISEPLDLVTAL